MPPGCRTYRVVVLLSVVSLLRCRRLSTKSDSRKDFRQAHTILRNGFAPGASSSSSSSASAQSTDPSKYVGAETCKTCHEKIYDGWEKTPHWKTTLDTKGGPSHQGCEGCHGPGADHVAGGGDVTKIFTFKNASTKEINARCMTCHAGGPQHMNAINSVHTQNNVSCISCHSPHHSRNKRIPSGESAAAALLHLPLTAEIPIRDAISPPRE